MKSEQQAGAILFFQLPTIPQYILKTPLRAVGIHEVKQVFQAGTWVAHINNRDVFCSSVDSAVNSLIVPIIIGAELRGIGPLCVNQHGIIK